MMIENNKNFFADSLMYVCVLETSRGGHVPCPCYIACTIIIDSGVIDLPVYQMRVIPYTCVYILIDRRRIHIPVIAIRWPHFYSPTDNTNINI